MQISRLFTMVYILMERKSVTAAELAERFEVSTRTIYRDLDKLAQGGIPVYTNRGKGGGISLTEGFVINKTLLSEREQENIIFGLQNLKSLNIPGNENSVIDDAINKLGALFKNTEKDWIKVDLDSWGENLTDENLFQSLQKAIFAEKIVNFTYYGRKAEAEIRQVEPCQLQFKGRNWYLYGFCLSRGAFRLFKLNRIDHLKIGSETFQKRACPELSKKDISESLVMTDLLLKVDSSLAWRVYDEFPRSSFTRSGNGDFTIRVSFPEDEWVYGYLMSFGDMARVLSPNRIRRLLKKRFTQAAKNYS